MPIVYRYEAATRIVRIEFSGEIAEAELVDVAHQLATDSSLPPHTASSSTSGASSGRA